MSAKDFVESFKKEMDYSVELYTNGEAETRVSALIAEMKLDVQQQEKMKEVISALLNDTYYGLLMGLNGSSSIGDIQQTYTIHDEDGQLISDGFCLEEGGLWEAFNE
jgi:hypothetical protein